MADEKIGSLAIDLQANVGDVADMAKFATAAERLEKQVNALAVAFDFLDAAMKPLITTSNRFLKMVKVFEAGVARYAQAVGSFSRIQRTMVDETFTRRFEAGMQDRVDAIKAVGAAAKQTAADLRGAKNLTDGPTVPRTSGPRPPGAAAGFSAGGAGSFSAAGINDEVGRLAGRSVLAGVATTAALGAASTAVGTNFQATLQRVASIGGLTAEQLAAVEKQARQLGKTTQFTATQAADAFVVLAQAGVGVEESLVASNSALALAATLNTSLEGAISLLVSTQRQFNLTAEDSALISDTFNKAAKTSLLDFEKLREGLKFAGPVGAQFGLELSEVTATLSALADLGLTGEQTGTVFRSALVALTRLTGKQAQVLKELGLEYKDINPQANTFVEIIEKLAKAGLNASQANALFGTVAAPVGSLVSQEALNPGALRSRRAALANPFGETEKQFQDVQKTLLFAFQSLRSSVEELLLTLFDSFEEPLKKIVVAFTAVVDAISQEYGRVSGQVADELGGGVDAFTSKLTNNRVTIARVFVDLTKSVANFAIVLADVGAAFVRFAPFVKAFGAAVVAAFVVSKIGAFITAIGGIVVAFSGATAATTTFSLALAASTGGLSLALTAVAALAAGLLTLAFNYDNAARSAAVFEAAQKRVDERRDTNAAAFLNDRVVDAARVALASTEQRRNEAVARLQGGDTDVSDEVIDSLESQLARLRDIIADPSLGGQALDAGSAILRRTASGEELVLLEESVDAIRRAFKESRTSFLEFASPLGTSVEGSISVLEAVAEKEQAGLDKLRERLAEGRRLQQTFEATTDPLQRAGAGLDLRRFTGGQTAEEGIALLNNIPQTAADAEARLGGVLGVLTRIRDLQTRGTGSPFEAPANDQGYGNLVAQREQAATNALDALRRALQALQDQATQAGQDEAVKIVEQARAKFDALERIAEEATVKLAEAGKLSKAAVEEIDAAIAKGKELTAQIVGQQLDELIKKRSDDAQKAIEAVDASLDQLSDGSPVAGVLRRAAQDLEKFRAAADAAEKAIDLRKVATDTQALFDQDYDALVASAEAALADRIAVERTFAKARLDIAERTLTQIRDVELREAEETARLREQIDSGVAGFLGETPGAAAKRALVRQLTEFERIQTQIAQQAVRKRATIEAEAAAKIALIREQTAQAVKTLGVAEAKAAQDVADKKIAEIQRVAEAATQQSFDEQTEQGLKDTKDTTRTKRVGTRQANKELRDGIADAVNEGFTLGATTFAREGLDRLGREIVGRLGQALVSGLKLFGLTDEEEAERLVARIGKSLGKFVGLYVSVIKAMVDALRAAGDYLKDAFDEVFGVDLNVRSQAVAATGTFTEARSRGQLSRTEEVRFGRRQVLDQVEQAQTTAESFPGIVNGVVAGFAEGTPKLINAFVSIIPALATGIIGAFDQIILKIVDAAPRIATALAEAIPRIVDAVVPEIPRIVEALGKSINILLRAVLKVLPDIINGLVDGLVVFIEKVVPKLVVTVANNIGPIVTALVRAVPRLLLAFANSLPKIIPALVDAAIEIAFALIPALVEMSGQIVLEVIPQIVVGISEGVSKALKDLLQKLAEPFLRIFAPKKANELYGKEDRDPKFLGKLVSSLSYGFRRLGDADAEAPAWIEREQKIRQSRSKEDRAADRRHAVEGLGFAVGSANVPYDMTARIHEGERILTRAQNAIYSAAERMRAVQMPNIQAPTMSANGLGGAMTIQVILDGRMIDAFEVQSSMRGNNGRSTAQRNRRSGVKVGRVPAGG